jgi:hypothetical protein
MFALVSVLSPGVVLGGYPKTAFDRKGSSGSETIIVL